MKYVLIIVILIVLIVLCVAAFLLYLIHNPMLFIKHIRGDGNEESNSNMTYPDNYQDYERKIKVEYDLEYFSTFKDSTFDLYLPKSASKDKKLPVMVWVHGGGFIAGDKCGVKNLATMTAASGYSVAALNYQVAPEARYPAAIIQLNEFFVKLLSMEDKYPELDLNKIFLCGDSAGAQIASQYAAVVTNPELAKEMNIKPSLRKEMIAGVIFCSGPFDLPAVLTVKNYKLKYFTTLWGRAYFGKPKWHKSKEAKQVTIVNHITSNYPPTYITDGNVGSFEKQGRRLGEALRSVNVQVKELYFDMKNEVVNHDYLFNLKEPISQFALQDILNFMNSNID